MSTETTHDATTEPTPPPKAKLARSASAEAKAPRGKLDPIEKPLWRMKRADRRAILEPFVGQQVRLDRWFGRVASHGDRQYIGTLLAVAVTTTGSTADFLILATVDGTVWAISTAQVYYLALHEPPRTSKTAAATAARVAKAKARKEAAESAQAAA